LVLITNIVVLNASADTADSLNPAKNTLLKLDSTDDDSGGGGLGLIELLLFFVLLYSVKNRFRSSDLVPSYTDRGNQQK
jgi:hypothetical protein